METMVGVDESQEQFHNIRIYRAQNIQILERNEFEKNMYESAHYLF